MILLASPKIVKNVQIYEVVEGKSFEIKCPISPFAYPEPTVLWKKVCNNDVDVVVRNHFLSLLQDSTILQEASGTSFRIETVNQTDQGLYTCIANNSVGSDESAPNKLVVLYKPRIKRSLSEPEVKKYHTGDSVLIECEANGMPNPHVSTLLPGRLKF